MSIVAEHVGFSYCTRAVLRDVSFFAADGSMLAVLGPNGVGKTTLFRCILGLQKGYTGSLTVGGAEARSLSARALAEKIAYIPQVHGAAFAYTVRDMVLMGTAHGVGTLSVPGKASLAAADEAMERIGILHLANKNFTHLSGGEQQLVLIARALSQRAKTLLMDEPTASLDYGNQARVLSAVRSLADNGYSVVLSTHNPQHALTYADAALALCEGAVAAFGAPEAVLDAALIERLYGMRVRMIRTAAGLLIAPEPQGRANDVSVE